MYIQEFNQDVVDWAAAQISVLSGRHGFPDSAAGIQALIRALLRICHPALVSLRASHVELGNGAIDAALAATPEELDKIQIRTSAGPVKPLTWLVDAAVERWVFMPAPVELRQIFIDEVGPAADGEVFAVPARAKAEGASE